MCLTLKLFCDIANLLVRFVLEYFSLEYLNVHPSTPRKPPFKKLAIEDIEMTKCAAQPYISTFEKKNCSANKLSILG